MQHKKKYVSWGLSENWLGRSRVVRPPNKCIPMELNMYMMELDMYMMAKRRSNISVLHANYVPIGSNFLLLFVSMVHIAITMLRLYEDHTQPIYLKTRIPVSWYQQRPNQSSWSIFSLDSSLFLACCSFTLICPMLYCSSIVEVHRNIYIQPAIEKKITLHISTLTSTFESCWQYT